jgi:hypothetical protein
VDAEGRGRGGRGGQLGNSLSFLQGLVACAELGLLC